MIEPEKRKAIYLLHEEGMSNRKIARQLHVSRNTVDEIIDQKGELLCVERSDKIEIDEELLRRLHRECEGWVRRMFEVLTEDMGIHVGYSTLTAMVRELGLGAARTQRCDRVPDAPGQEMQHDTSDYTLLIDGKRVKVIASLLYFRFSKVRYLKFYRFFNRFKMKCFFHEALTHWKYTAKICIIDNTSLARLRGTGANAVIVPEMVEYSRQFGFTFVCHAKGHANRKAGNERSFFTVETNFFPGRTFDSLEDLNAQALEWATVRMPRRPLDKTRLIPALLFEQEKDVLIPLPPYLEPPYLNHERDVDEYGYIAFASNYYWVPGASRFEAKVLEYSDHITIYQNRKLLVSYVFPPFGVKNERFSPEGYPKPPRQPRNRKHSTDQEEKALRHMGEEADSYLNFVYTQKGIARHRFIRALYGLSRRLAGELFLKTVARALKYRITDIETLERIATLLLQDGVYTLPSVDLCEDLETRDAYLEGAVSDEVDLSIYDKMYEDTDE